MGAKLFQKNVVMNIYCVLAAPAFPCKFSLTIFAAMWVLCENERDHSEVQLTA